MRNCNIWILIKNVSDRIEIPTFQSFQSKFTHILSSFNVICEWFRQAAGPKCQPFYLLGQRNVSLYAEPSEAVDGLQRPWGHRDRQPFRPPWPRDDRLEQQQFNWFATWDILIFFPWYTGLISIRQNWSFDMLAMIWHEIVCWLLKIY